MVGKKPAVAGAVGSTALATSPVRVPRRARPGGHSFKLRAGSQPARSCRPAYGPLMMLDPKTRQDTGQTRSADLTPIPDALITPNPQTRLACPWPLVEGIDVEP